MSEPKRPRRWGIVLSLLCAIAGMVTLLYPVVATQYNNVRQAQFSAQYNHDAMALDSGARTKALEAARAYNATLKGVPILDPYLSSIRFRQSEAYQAYLAQLSNTEQMGRLRVPAVKIDLPIYHGTADETIARGAGHLYGTSLPVGGSGSHAVLTSHTGLANATLFDHLSDVGKGDLIFADVLGETVTYQVDSIKTVLPNEVSDLVAQPGKDLLTLFTCTPYGVNTHRLLVSGHRVPNPPQAAVPDPTVVAATTLQPWMYGLIAGSAGFALIIVFIGVHEAKERRRRLAHVSE